jgi:hypothetical protein
MKKVFSSNEKLIDKWLKQDQDFVKNQSRSLYFEKETIYSFCERCNKPSKEIYYYFSTKEKSFDKKC